MISYRSKEVHDAILHFQKEMHQLHILRLELSMQEKHAWDQLQAVLLAEDPQLLSPYFKVSNGPT